MTDTHSATVLEPTADAFRNYYSKAAYASPVKMLVELANLYFNQMLQSIHKPLFS